jgi:flagella basal body P-ring formation protein FlgA
MLILLVVSMFAFIANIQRAAAISLKAESLVTGEHITVGDVFNDLKHNADFVLAPAPKPGHDLVWNASTLNRIARAFDLPWTPDSQFTQLRIRRLATVISNHEIKARLQSKLKDTGLSPDTYEISIEGLSQDGLILPYGSETSFILENVDYNPAARLVRATLKSPAYGPAIKTLSLHGYVVDVERIPVLKNRMRRGDIIKASDIQYINVQTDSLAHDVILNAEEIIGTTPRTSLNSASPIRSFDLQHPKIVKRGDKVTMVYSNGRVHIETIGKALEGGAKGDIIRVANGSSNKTIQAEIIADQKVSVN